MTDWLAQRLGVLQSVEVACVGEAMMELSQYNAAAQSIDLKYAGDCFNTAIYAARCADERIRVSFASAVGEDGFSDQLVAQVEAEGIEAARLYRHPSRLLGMYAIELDAQGERSFCYWRDQSAAKQMMTLAPDILVGADVVYLSGITLAILDDAGREALIEALGNKVVLFDTNYRARLWQGPEEAARWYRPLLERADISLCSSEDLDAIFGEDCPQLTGEWMVRSGSTSIDTADGLIDDLPKAPKIVDTTGAGDSFNGAYLIARLKGEPMGEAIRFAHAQALDVIAQPGAILPRG